MPSAESPIPSTTAAEAGDHDGRSADNAARYSDLVTKAINEFAVHGYRATSMRAIADAVGLSKPSLYHYVRNKEELLVGAYDSVLDHNLLRYRSIIERHLPADEALRDLLISMTVYNCDNRNLLRVFYEEEREIPIGLMNLVQGRRRQQEDAVVSIVEAGIDDGSFRNDLSPRTTVRAMMGSIMFAYKWYHPEGPETPQELAERMVDFLLGGLRASVAN
jgi:TetR/AcrR family transcriptional regulator, cholesterol catabolism regulator